MTLRDLKAKVDELCERDPQAAIALARRIQNKLQPGFPMPLTMLHQSLVGRAIQGIAPEQLEKTREMLARQGLDDMEIELAISELSKPGLRAGQAFGGLHLEDITAIVETIWRQGAGKITLEIQFENPDDDHLTLTIVGTGKAWWQEQSEGGS